ncbi:MAG: hypothetical protein V1734_03605 [Nanoarchaeota archaeon]
MKKIFVLFLVVLLLMSSIAAAGFWDLITGRATATREYSVTLCTDAAVSHNSGDFSFLNDMEYLMMDHRAHTAHRTDSNGIVRITWGSMMGMDRIKLLYAADKYKGTTMFADYNVGDNKELVPGLTIKVNSIYNPANRKNTVAVAARCADLVVSRQVEVADVAVVANTPLATVQKQPGLMARLFGAKTVVRAPVAPSTPEVTAVAEEAVAAPVAPTSGAGNCKYIPNSELITVDGYDVIKPQEVCSKLGYASCLLGYMYNSFGYYSATNCNGNVQWTDLQYEPVACDIGGSHEVHCIGSSEHGFGSRTQVRYVHSAVCCK